jgi:hypothetical protein
MKHSSSKKRVKPTGLNEKNLIAASLILMAWSFVIETYVPVAWFNSAPAFWDFMSAFSLFIVAAVLAYTLVFDVFKSHYLRTALSLLSAIALFIFGLALGPINQQLPPGIGSSLAWGNLFIAVYFGAAFALVAIIASKVLYNRSAKFGLKLNNKHH